MRLTIQAIEAAMGWGFDDLKELEYAVEHSAVTTHPLGNRRYKGLVFQVVEGEVVDVNLFDDSPVTEESTCEYCGGSGFAQQWDDELEKHVQVPCLH